MLTAEPLPYSDTIEDIPPDESEMIARAVETLKGLLERNSSLRGRRDRDVHVKSHGNVTAVFRVLGHLPRELAQGLFAQPEEYPAVMRFSNTSPFRLFDFLPDGRGLAIQIQGINPDMLLDQQTSATQDFLMANHPTFIARNVAEYLQLQMSRLNASRLGVGAATRFLTRESWNPRQWNWAAAAAMAHVGTQFPRHPAGYVYHSMVPFRFGDYVVKYRVEPTRATLRRWLPQVLWQPDAMRNSLSGSLRGGSLEFEFQVQVRTSAGMPIEDATVEWSEAESPYRTVAVIYVPPQPVRPPTSSAGDEVRFDVWNCLTSHRPLGGINRVRRFAYPASVGWRSGTPFSIRNGADNNDR